ncbi:MAG: Gx transporter family protein [Oscillospiraceae bacterium]|nr:Gx transporter family protein [Oscillospiraceae bacterium]
MSKSKKIALCGVLAGLAFALSYIEMLLPSIGIVGAKLGLANLAVLIALYLFSWREAAAVSGVRIILSWLMFGSFTGLIYSLCGGVLSLAVMSILKKIDKFSPVGVSIAGGVGHNLGQILAAFALLGSGIFGYLPLLIIFGAVFGGIIGVVAAILIKALKKVVKADG